MRKPQDQRLRDVLDSLGIQPHLVLAAVRDMYGVSKTARHATQADAAWDVLRAQLRHDMRSVSSNRAHWQPWMAPLYEEYLTIMRGVDAKIERVSTRPLPGSPLEAYPSLAEYTRHMRAVNTRREKEGRLVLGDHNTQWQSWVPRDVRVSLCERVAVTYDKQEKIRGRRFVPFVTASMRDSYRIRLSRLASAIETHRQLAIDFGTHTAGTPYRALQLAAARQAELALNALTARLDSGLTHMLDVSVPVNWYHLLDAPMRERLRRAQKNKADVSLQGLGSFYRVLVPADALPESDVAAFAAAPVDDGVVAQDLSFLFTPTAPEPVVQTAPDYADPKWNYLFAK